MIVFLQLTIAGSDSGPFNLYSDLDGYTIPFETDVFKSSLEAGYTTTAPDGTQTVKVVSTGACINSTYITLAIPDCDLAGYVEEITTTTSTSTSSTTTTTTTAEPIITNVTEINIFFDSSGSMNDTLPPLEYMRDNLLKDCIGPIYGYDPLVPGSDALYNTRVKVIALGNERFVSWLASTRNYGRAIDLTVNQVLNLTFADESNVYGYGGAGAFNNATRTATYDEDIVTLRNNFTASPYIKGYAFRVNTGPDFYPGFRGLTEATFVDTGVYVPPYNISDLTANFSYDLDVIAGVSILTTPAADQAPYYLNKVVTGLNTLGFILNCSPTTTTTTTL